MTCLELSSKQKSRGLTVTCSGVLGNQDAVAWGMELEKALWRRLDFA